MRIQVTPDLLRATAVQIRQSLDRLEEVSITIRRAWDGLDWEVRQEAALELQIVQAQRQAMALQEEGERLRRFLEERAAAFEEADREGVVRLGQTFHRWSAQTGDALSRSLRTSLIFPAQRAQASLRPGTLLGADLPLVRPTRVFIEPEERRALLHYGIDVAISKIGPLGLLKDVLDLTRLPGWQARVDQAFQLYLESATRYGVHSPQAQNAYGRYVEIFIYQMPFFGTGAKALISVLNILGRARPVE
ncbi:MAG: hypothetical protein ACUVSH_10945 [Anaerolineae bacterium]